MFCYSVIWAFQAATTNNLDLVKSNRCDKFESITVFMKIFKLKLIRVTHNSDSTSIQLLVCFFSLYSHSLSPYQITFSKITLTRSSSKNTKPQIENTNPEVIFIISHLKRSGRNTNSFLMQWDPRSRGPPSGPHQGVFPIKCLP